MSDAISKDLEVDVWSDIVQEDDQELASMTQVLLQQISTSGEGTAFLDMSDKKSSEDIGEKMVKDFLSEVKVEKIVQN
jgi:hypothetical protein